ncbi:MAG: hypothetical protein FJ038_09160 [Chloroflexi bacterium]|nr:hypothetical protein [Chloroflexota bacterium]
MRRRVATTAIAAVLALLPWAPAVLAAVVVDWGSGRSSVTFGSEIRFEQPITLAPIAVRRVELLLQVEGEVGPRVQQVQGAGDLSSGTLRSRFDLIDNHLYPNTDLVARFRITAADGEVAMGPDIALTYLDERFIWRTVDGRTAAGSTVRVHWFEGNDAFGRRALEIVRVGIEKSETRLGVTEREPIDFYIYAETNDFYGALGPGSRENVGGVALAEIRTLFAQIDPAEINDSWVETVIPHELAHLVFHTAVDNPYHDPPRWLNEGLAVYESEGYGSSDRLRVAAAVDSGQLIPLVGLAGLFPTTYDQFALAYAESVSAVDFLVRTHGADALVRLIRSYADGITDDEAFEAAIGISVAEFDAAWQRDVNAAAPSEYGPQPPPPGPLPSGWSRTPDTAPATSAPTPGGTGTPVASSAASVAPATAAPATAEPPATGTAATAAPTPGGATPAPTLALGPITPRSGGLDNSTLGIILGAVAVVLAIGGLALILNSRRAPGAP